MTTQTATKDPRALVKADITGALEEFRLALPKHLPAERFTRTAVTVLMTKPDICKAAVATPEGRRSLLTACMKAANDGLVLDDREATVVIRRKKEKDNSYSEMVSYMPMTQGLLKKARNSGEISTIAAHVVYEKDYFLYEMGDDERLVHRPFLDGERGRMRFAYMVAHLKDGGIVREVLTSTDIDKIRSKSQSADKGPWRDWPEEMWRKSAIRRGSKYLPSSTDREDGSSFAETLHSDDELYEDAAELPAAAEPESAAPRKGRRAGRILDGAPEPAAAAAEPTGAPANAAAMGNGPVIDHEPAGEAAGGDII